MAASISALALLTGCGGSSGDGSFALPAPPPDPPPPPPAEINVSTEVVFNAVSMASPVALLQAPGDNSRWFVVEQQGIVRSFPNDPNVSNADVGVFADIRLRVLGGGERGLLGMAFHPAFGGGNFEVFLSYTGTNAGESIINRFRSIDNGATLDTSVDDIVLTIPQPFANHNGGNIAFGPDGFLYAGWGDGGSAGDPNDHAQDTSNLLGTITRIDVDSAMPYAIPADNPFAGNAANPCTQGFGGGDCPEIYAYGFRNPWRWSFDRLTGELWVGDVGQNQWEEVDLVTAGGNYGWRCREGMHDFDLTGSGCGGALIDPITEYDHSLGQSITGGYVYRGSAIPELQGFYVYGDFVTGRIFAIAATSQQGTVGEEIFNTPFNISAFAQDQDSELYIVDYGGSVHRIIDAP
ncbi:MAG: PQQ-dependent sugar dehydrogenase [Woeseiaceae bacterium]|nr:PQQ-dependent sugar dehydrogenase [Woeseiaceae bacterium]